MRDTAATRGCMNMHLDNLQRPVVLSIKVISQRSRSHVFCVFLSAWYLRAVLSLERGFYSYLLLLLLLVIHLAGGVRDGAPERSKGSLVFIIFSSRVASCDTSLPYKITHCSLWETGVDKSGDSLKNTQERGKGKGKRGRGKRETGTFEAVLIANSCAYSNVVQVCWLLVRWRCVAFSARTNCQ